MSKTKSSVVSKETKTMENWDLITRPFVRFVAQLDEHFGESAKILIAKLCNLIETTGLSESQQGASKSLVKTFVYDFQKEIENILSSRHRMNKVRDLVIKYYGKEDIEYSEEDVEHWF